MERRDIKVLLRAKKQIRIAKRLQFITVFVMAISAWLLVYGVDVPWIHYIIAGGACGLILLSLDIGGVLLVSKQQLVDILEKEASKSSEALILMNEEHKRLK